MCTATTAPDRSGRCAVVDGAVTEEVEIGNVESLVSFGEDITGELYALSLNGPVLRFDPA